MTDDERASQSTARRDAVLTLLVLVVVGGVAVARSAPADPFVFAAGAVGAGVLELILSFRAATVRAYWTKPSVQVAAVLIAVVGGIGVAAITGPWVMTALVGGLCGYLALLGASVWIRRRNH